MSTGQQSVRQQQQGTAQPSSELDKLLARSVKYTPFAEQEEIELSFGQVKNFISARTKKGNLPSDQDIVKFMMLCKARELNPWVGDAYLIGYDTQDGPTFSLITAIQALFKRAEANPHFRGMQSGVIVRAQDGVLTEREGDFTMPGEALLGSWCKVFRDDRAVPFYDALKLTTYDKGFGQWKNDKEGMIVKCAEASALRKAFPSQLSGLYVSQEADAIKAGGEIREAAAAAQARTLSELAATIAAKPTVQHVSDADEPTTTEPLGQESPEAVFDRYLEVLVKATTVKAAGEVYDAFFGPESAHQWTAEQNAEGAKARTDHIDLIRSK